MDTGRQDVRRGVGGLVADSMSANPFAQVAKSFSYERFLAYRKMVQQQVDKPSRREPRQEYKVLPQWLAGWLRIE